MGYIIIITAVLGLMAHGIWRKLSRKSQVMRRGKYIDAFTFPATVKHRLLEQYPHLNGDQAEMVLNGLRDYFHICNIAGKKWVSMPSQSVDVVWHEFILFTLQYQNFCKKALGRFLHHVPAEAMKRPTAAQQGIKLAWKIACQREGISPGAPDRLPRIFALDALLRIPSGFTYTLNCRKRQMTDASSGATYCAGDIGCSSSCGSGGCSSGGDGDSSCGGGCGGGGD